jgi:hypothetical protein
MVTPRSVAHKTRKRVLSYLHASGGQSGSTAPAFLGTPIDSARKAATRRSNFFFTVKSPSVECDCTVIVRPRMGPRTKFAI